jgi:hypothetical protein
MHKLTIVECHNLSDQGVKERINKYIHTIKSQNKDLVDIANVEWDGNHGSLNLSAVGLRFTGQIRVEKEFITIKGELPPIAADYSDQLEEIIRYEIYHLLN